MRKTILSVALAGVLALGVVPGARAQDSAWSGHHHRMNAEEQLQRLTSKLGLSPVQQEQIRPILVGRQKQMRALRQNTALSPEERRSQMRSIQRDSNANIEALLSDHQRKKFEAMLQRRRHHA